MRTVSTFVSLKDEVPDVLKHALLVSFKVE